MSSSLIIINPLRPFSAGRSVQARDASQARLATWKEMERSTWGTAGRLGSRVP